MAPSTRVLPLVNVPRAVVELRIGGTWHSFHVAEPAALAATLANAVDAPRWDRATRILAVRIPKSGSAVGRAVFFSLSEFSRPLPSARLVG